MFHSARIKLTLWYLIIIMAVSGFFSLIVYRGFEKELGRGFRSQVMQPFVQRRVLIQNEGGFTRILPFVIYPDEVAPEQFAEVVNLAKRRFALQLLIINGGILFLAGTLGYMLAGKTLQPIGVMLDDQKRFVADASHELRTPLASMKTEVEVALRDKKLDLKTAKDLLKSNLSEVNKMKYFSDSMLALSKYETNGKNILTQEVDLAEAAKQAIERNIAQAKEKKVKIEEDLDDVTVKGDPESLVELISIFINNAVKYSDKGKSIGVSLKRTKHKATVSIRDEGVGISQEDIPHIFDRFYRADNSRCKNKTEGYGLGLSIAKSIALLHKAEIKVESKLGDGSTFTVIFQI